MTTNLNSSKCSNCGHDGNAATAVKCEICGKRLRKTASPLPLMGAGLLACAIVAGGVYFFKDHLPGLAPTVATTDTFTAAANQPNPSANSVAQSPVAAAPSNAPQIKGAVVATYSNLAKVPNVPQGVFNYGGSTTFAPLRSNTIVETFKQAFPQFQLRYTEPTTGKPGSGKGIEMLLDGQLSFAQSSRSLKDEEYAQAKNRGFALEQVPVAIDGIALYINPKLMALGVKGLTLAQVKDIFTGKVQNWQQVGGPNMKITPFSRNLQAGGTVNFFYEHVLEKQALGATVQEVRDTTDVARQVARVPGGVGYATASEVINQQTIRLIGIAKEANQPFVLPCADAGCTAINQKALADDSYPITRRLFVIIKRDGKLDEQAGVAYANMLLSDQGQKLIGQVGFVTIR